MEMVVLVTTAKIVSCLFFSLVIAGCIGYKLEKLTSKEEIQLKRKIVFHEEKWNKKTYKIKKQKYIHIEKTLRELFVKEITLSKEEEKRLALKIEGYNKIITEKEINEDVYEAISESLIKLQNELESGAFLVEYNKEKKALFEKLREKMIELSIPKGKGVENLKMAIIAAQEKGKDQEIKKEMKIARDVNDENYDFLNEENKDLLEKLKDDMGYFIVNYTEKEEKERKERYKKRIEEELDGIEKI